MGSRQRFCRNEILPGVPGHIRPIRILARETPYYSNDSHWWSPDDYFEGGQLAARGLSLSNAEERKLKTPGHTIHFDGYNDQGRDVKNTRVLLAKGARTSREINTTDRESGLTEMHHLLDGIMKGKEMLISFYCLGPRHSIFSQLAMQITDSAYVTHSEMILYRPGFEEFKSLKDKDDFFFFIHSSGELDEHGETKHPDKRRIYIDLEKNSVFTVNNQYAGNSVGLKKLALRLSINKANHSDWLAEHMFISGIKRGGRTTYFTGAYPSACGKTSTAMIPGHSLVGDDIAYLCIDGHGVPHAANVEQGIFGIITDVNPIDDPLIYRVITAPRELIFSNVLINKGKPYWLGMGRELPRTGVNFIGRWHKGMIGPDGKEVPPAHKNARYTLRLIELENADKRWDDPNGVPVSGIFFGVRDSSTNVPIAQSFSWGHGVLLGASTESETTAAVIGKEGTVEHDPMSILDFLVVPLGLYMKNYLAFGGRCKKRPLIFTTNYFLKHGNEFLNDKVDKKVWLAWADGRVNNEYGT